MKAFALILFCVVAAAQGRSTAVQPSDSAGSSYVVHLRVAIGTSGLLNSCVGSFINQRWVLTSAGCVHDARFIWVRFFPENVFQPELVLEISWTAAGGTLIQRHPQYNAATGENDIALLNLNRDVHSTPTISPVAIGTAISDVPETGTVCGFGQEANNAPGENLKCVDVDVVAVADTGATIVVSEEAEATNYDIGAPLVAEGVQFGILSVPRGNEATFVNPAYYRDWIRSTTGVDL